MKKAIVLLFSCSLFVLTSCNLSSLNLTGSSSMTVSEISNPNTISTQEESVDSILYGEEYINARLKDYWLTYSFITKSNGVEEEPVMISVARNSDGYYFKDNNGGEALYLKNGEKFDVYLPNDDGKLALVEGIKYDKEEVEAFTSSFLNFMLIYEISLTDLERDGIENIAGRSCDKFVFHAAYFDSAVDIKYSIDQETGVCLRYHTQVISGKDTGAFEFLATVFKTTGVVLPEHI